MGKPYKILDLAVKTLKNSHFSYDKSMIEVTGLQVGEKLTEILFTPNESNKMSKQEGMFVIANRDDTLLSEGEMRLLFSGEINCLYKKLAMIQ